MPSAVCPRGRDRLERRTSDASSGVACVDRCHLVAEHDARRDQTEPHRGLARGRRQTGDARRRSPAPPRGGAHDLPLGAPRPRQGAEPGGPPDHPLGDGPREPGPDERLVVEARPASSRCSRSVTCEQVPLGVDGQPPARSTRIPSRHGAVHARTAGCPSTVMQAVRAVARAAVQAAAPVVLQRPRERAHAGAEQRRRRRGRPRGTGPHAPRTGAMPRLSSIPFVRVSRVTVVQVRHPDAWNHRSRCGPSAFSGR